MKAKKGSLKLLLFVMTSTNSYLVPHILSTIRGYIILYYIILSEDKFTQKIHPDVPALTCMRKAQELPLPQKDSKKDLEMNGHIL